ncbi:MAG: 50S ribosomal protein L35 [Parcubacteria group bacterium]|nr:50S ribosomal protein L35 [Parcubacteria group bacterium]
MKTNKSYTKRLKVTKNGKMLARRGGQNHFRARKSKSDKLDRNRMRSFTMSAKSKQRFIN